MYVIYWILPVDIYRPLSALILLQRELRRSLSKWYNNVCDAVMVTLHDMYVYLEVV
jgi:hypothetical protein